MDTKAEKKPYTKPTATPVTSPAFDKI